VIVRCSTVLVATRRGALAGCTVAMLAAFCAAHPAYAQPQDANAEPPQSPVELLDPLDPDKPDERWQDGRVRWFISGSFDGGFLYLRPRFSAGFGQPHHRWVGVDANPVGSAEGLGAYAGLRATLPAVDLRVGGRYFHTFERSLLCPTTDFERAARCEDEPLLERYDREDIESRVGPHSAYLTWETELTVDLPLGPGAIGAEAALSYVTGVDAGYFVYEETIKTVIDPPWIARARAGYSVPVDAGKAVRVGLVAEAVRIVGRDLYVVRGGIVGSVQLYNNIEARGSFIPVLKAEDKLGAAGGDTFLLGIRYRWATR
jgi:hypothetical protein